MTQSSFVTGEQQRSGLCAFCGSDRIKDSEVDGPAFLRLRIGEPCGVYVCLGCGAHRQQYRGEPDGPWIPRVPDASVVPHRTPLMDKVMRG